MVTQNDHENACIYWINSCWIWRFRRYVRVYISRCIGTRMLQDLYRYNNLESLDVCFPRLVRAWTLLLGWGRKTKVPKKISRRVRRSNPVANEGRRRIPASSRCHLDGGRSAGGLFTSSSAGGRKSKSSIHHQHAERWKLEHPSGASESSKTLGLA
jgi:hypothetical protein